MSRGERQLLICAGLDPSGGAGLLADVRTADALGVRPTGVVTAHTVQNHLGVHAVQPVPVALLAAELAALRIHEPGRAPPAASPPNATASLAAWGAAKLGMLGAASLVPTLRDAFVELKVPVVWDPVLRAGGNDHTLWAHDGAISPAADYQTELTMLGPLTTLLTPNLPELQQLTGCAALADEADVIHAAQTLRGRAGCTAVLVKGGHAEGATAIDFLVAADAVTRLTLPRLVGGHALHGTGCALATGIAAQLALGQTLPQACRLAKAWLHERMAWCLAQGQGAIW